MVLELEFLRRKLARMDAHVEDYAARARADAEAECAEKVARLEKQLAGQKSATEALRQEMNNEMLQGKSCLSSCHHLKSAKQLLNLLTTMKGRHSQASLASNVCRHPCLILAPKGRSFE